MDWLSEFFKKRTEDETEKAIQMLKSQLYELELRKKREAVRGYSPSDGFVFFQMISGSDLLSHGLPPQYHRRWRA